MKQQHQKKTKEENRHNAAVAARKKHNQAVAYWATLYQASPATFSSALADYPDICDVVHSGFKARKVAIGIDPKPGEFELEVNTEYRRRAEAARKAAAADGIERIKRGR